METVHAERRNMLQQMLKCANAMCYNEIMPQPSFASGVLRAAPGPKEGSCVFPTLLFFLCTYACRYNCDAGCNQAAG